MSMMMIFLAIVVLGGAIWMFMRIRKRDTRGVPQQTQDNSGVWAQASESEDYLLGRVLIGVAKPISKSQRIKDLAIQEDLGWLQRMLLAAGSPYGGSVEVFLSVQTGAILLGVVIVLIGAFTKGLFPVWLTAGLGAVVMFVPISRLYDQAKKRGNAVLQDLPDFVDLLMIPIVAGVGIKRSLRQTTERFYGPVQSEMENAIAMVDVGKPLSEALWYVGHRLAVPEARVFFSALAQAEQQGSSVRELLEKQRDALRHESFQKQRAEIKKIPTKIVFVFALHFMPVLFAVAFVPLIAALGQIG